MYMCVVVASLSSAGCVSCSVQCLKQEIISFLHAKIDIGLLATSVVLFLIVVLLSVVAGCHFHIESTT